MKRFGYFIGATAGLLIVLALLRSPDSRSPAGVMLALIFGAVRWFIVTAAGERGKANLGHKFAVTVALLLVVPLVYSALQIFLPPPKFAPANAKTRQTCALAKGTLSDAQGMGLPMSVEGGIRNTGGVGSVRMMLFGRCSTLRRTWYGASAGSVASQGGYIAGDEGWRWDMVEDSPPVALVFPDPLLVSQPGPVFDVRSHRILRRENRDAPATTPARFWPPWPRAWHASSVAPPGSRATEHGMATARHCRWCCPAPLNRVVQRPHRRPALQ